MSDHENRTSQHSDPSKAGSEQKLNQPVQQKPQEQGAQPKGPQPDQAQHNQEKKKHA